MSWFEKLAPSIFGIKSESKIPAGVWIKCQKCNEVLYKNELENNLQVCLKCEFHFRINGHTRIKFLLDKDSFQEMDKGLKSSDPLKFTDVKKYKDRLKNEPKKADSDESVIGGVGTINGQQVSICAFNFFYMGGSMGIVAGEKITRSIERAIELSIPLIVVSASGGARMQEGTLSLMQMAKTSVALNKLKNKKLPYISILTDPTTGGVSASIAMLGDVILVEPGALVGFAGPRVIKQTIKQELPKGFQRAEFLLQHGVVDAIVSRNNLRQTITNLLSYLYPKKYLPPSS